MTITAALLRAGDIVELPGWMLHEDLAGLRIEVKITDVATRDGQVFLSHRDANGEPATTWLRDTESVTLLAHGKDVHVPSR